MGDIYDIMVKDLMARRQAEEEEDTDDDEEDEDEISSQSESDGEPVALDEAEREMLRRTLSMDADGEYDDDESPYPGGMEENGKERTEPQAEGSEEEEEMPKAKEVSAVLSMKPQQYTIDRRWASASTLPSLPMRDQGPAGRQKQSKQKEEGGGSPKSGNSSNNGSPSSSGSHFLSLRNLRSKDKESKTSKDGHQKKRSKEEAPPSSSSSSTSSSSSNGGKARKRDILRGTFLSLREEKQELRGKLHEWRAHRDSEKKEKKEEKEVDRELRKRTKEEAKAAAKHEPSSSSSSSSSSKRTARKQEEEWERKDRKAAEAYAKRYGLDRSFDDRPREGTKCYTSFDDNEVEDDAPLAPRPLLGARP
jgi:hypothetical protein